MRPNRTLNRRRFLQAAGLGALAATAPWLRAAAAERPPNIIILLADDQGWGDMGCAEHPVLQTPAIDRLAAEGTRFTNFYSTAPVCSPARAGLLTGRIQNRFGMDHIINEDEDVIPLFHHLPPNEPTLARQLRAVGYRTGHVGKWHLNFMHREGEPTFDDYGFDEAVMLAAGRYTSYRDSRWSRHTGERFQTEGRWTAEVYIDEAIDFIERAAGRPFFLNVWSFAPHIQVDCAERYRARYADRTEAEQLYFGAVTQMDEQYGRLLDYLDAQGLRENTIVVFSSDNGCTSPILPWVERSRGRAALRGSKHNLGEAGIRVPGIVRWPGVTPAGSVSHVPVSALDLMPTLCAAAGAERPAEWVFDGGDFRAALEGREVERPHPLYWQCKSVSLMDDKPESVRSHPLALRDGPWKLMCDLEFGALELYNLDTDPSEKWNMAGIHPDIAAGLLEKLKAIHADVNGPYSREADILNPLILERQARKRREARQEP